MSAIQPAIRSAIQPAVRSAVLSYGSLTAWTPLPLFANSEVGVWYDPSDFSTMFQTSTGTTPVTAVGDPVGLILDKSKGLAVSGEKATNGGFDADSGWTKGATWTISGGTANAGGTGSSLTQTMALTANALVQITYTVVSISSGNVKVQLQGGSAVVGTIRSSPGTYTEYLQNNTNTTVAFVAGSTTPNAVIDNVSVKELAGNHATQATAASRPILGRTPATGQRNLLTYTEQFDNAAWGGAGTKPTVTANDAIAPDGTQTADKLFFSVGGPGNRIQQTASNALAAPGTRMSVWLKGSVGGESIRVWNGWDSTDHTLTTSWARYEHQAVDTDPMHVATFMLSSNTGTPTIWAWGAQIEIGSSATAYQKVTAAYDVTEAGVADCYNLWFDGVDDGLATAAIDFTGTDAVGVFAGIRKSSDAARGTIVELTASAAANNGAFHLAAPNAASATIAFESKGTVLADAVAASGVAAPITAVLTGTSDISGDTAILRVNGAQADADTGDQGTGNFSNAVLYIGRRGGSSLPFKGSLHSLTVLGRTLTAGEIASAESYAAGKSGVTL